LPTLREKARDEIDAILQKYPTRRSAILPLCYLAQQEYGYMNPEAVREVAEILDLVLPKFKAWSAFIPCYAKRRRVNT